MRRFPIALVPGVLLTAAGVAEAGPAAACSCAGIPSTAVVHATGSEGDGAAPLDGADGTGAPGPPTPVLAAGALAPVVRGVVLRRRRRRAVR